MDRTEIRTRSQLIGGRFTSVASLAESASAASLSSACSARRRGSGLFPYNDDDA